MNAVKSLTAVCVLFVFVFSAAAQETTDKSDATKASPVEKIQPEVLTAVRNVGEAKRGDERYHIGLQDVLEINVYKHPELSQPNIRMDDEGKIRLPRIDTPIVAICKTENELGAEIAGLYKENYLRDPYVTVFVKEQNSQPMSVIGAVEKPGSFFTNRRLTLLELLSFAGGQDVNKAGSKIQVARVGGISGCKLETNSEAVEAGDAPTFFSYNLEDVLKGKTNPVMRPGDIVVVLEADQAYVTGNVLKPQSILLKQPITLTQAIAAAGGILPATKKSEVRLVRQTGAGGAKQELVFDLVAIRDRKIADPQLQANDIVEVPTDKIKSFTNSFINAVTGGLGNVIPYRIP